MPTTSALAAKQQAAADANARIAADREFDFAVEEYNAQRAETQLNLGNLDIQKAQNERDRQLQREDQYRQIASKYASRGLRTAAQAGETGRFEKQLTESRSKENDAINLAKSQAELRFGTMDRNPAGADIYSDPSRFGTVGAAARRAALARLQQQGITIANREL